MEDTVCGDNNTDRITGLKEKVLFGAGIAFCIFVFTISLLRSSMTGITYDEAYTYVAISSFNMLDVNYLGSLFSRAGCIANNHWLNSFLIFAMERLTGTGYDEFVIRFPSLMFFAIYLTAVCLCYRKKFFSFPVLILLAGNYYLDEFYGLARGYGMANTFVFLLCISMIRWRRSGYNEMKYLNLAMLYAMLAVFSNTIVLLLYPAFGIVCLFRLVSGRKIRSFLKRSGFMFIIFTAFSLLMTIYHLNISSEGKPLFTGVGHGFFHCFVKGYLRMFVTKENLVTIGSVLSICVIAAVYLIRWQGRLFSDAGALLIIFVMTNLLMEAVFHKGYITERVLLPFYSFMVLAISDVICSAAERFPKTFFRRMTGIAAAVLLCTACLFLFARKINLHATKDWSYEYKYKTMEIGQLITGIPFASEGGPIHVFYQDKYKFLVKDYRLLLEEENNIGMAENSAE